MARSRVGTLVVLDEARRLKGLLTERDLRFVDPRRRRPWPTRMTPLDAARGPHRAGVGRGGRTDHGRAQDEEAAVRGRERHAARPGDGASDLTKQRRLPFATRDEHGRLRVGAAIGATGDYLERAAELVKAGVDVLVIDIAHGHSVVMERAIVEVRKRIRRRGADCRQRRHRRRRPAS